MEQQEQDQDHYQVLGVNPRATETEIRKAYYNLALTWHPDKNAGGKERFVSIKKAYNTLSDPKQRSAFDSFLRKKEENEKEKEKRMNSTRTRRHSGSCSLYRHKPQPFTMPHWSPDTEFNYIRAAFFIGGVVVTGYATYKLVRSCILSPAATTDSAPSVINKIVVEHIYVIAPPYTPAQQVSTPLRFPMPELPIPPAEEVFKTVSAPPMALSLVSAAGAVFSAIFQALYRAWSWIVGVKNSDAASALGSKVTSTANFVSSASGKDVSEVGKWATDLKTAETATKVGSQLASSAKSLANTSIKVGKWASEIKNSETTSSLISTAVSSVMKVVAWIFNAIKMIFIG